ncbi:MAG: hypothetical protein AABY95_11215 [Pseudomonadota bacterium]
MKHRRTLIHLFAAVALLAQGMASAVVEPMAPMVETEQSMPCADSMPMDTSCCVEDCSCVGVCAGHVSVITPSFSFAAPVRADLQPQSFTGLRLSVNHTRRLRPPITVQS